jgi:hypothetical protein
MATHTVDTVDLIMRYESEGLEDAEVLQLFGHLIRTGMAWSLQGHYGRTAAYLIEHGHISPQGDVLTEVGE